MKSHRAAFTLLELVIALAIAAVLVAFAIPSYHRQIMRSYRIDAASALYRAAQFVEAAAPGDPGTLPAGLDQVPAAGAAIYQLSVMPADDTNGGYALEARPAAAGPMRDDACGTFILDATGLRTNRTTDGSAPPDAVVCWNGG
jgi:type IV pilus assembly protein PilE